MNQVVTHEYQTMDGLYSQAIYSLCYHYRYFLSRTWHDTGKRAAFLMLNPSTATEYQNDPTVERCQKRAVKKGYGAMTVINAFALRATDPGELRKAYDPIGHPLNNTYIKFTLSEVAKGNADIICAWGNNCTYLDRNSEIISLIKRFGIPAFCLGMSKKQEPKHPLYIAYEKDFEEITLQS